MDVPESTKAYLDYLRSVSDPIPLVVRDRAFSVLPGVFQPGAFPLDFFFRNLPLREGDDVLEIGAGHGILSILLHLERGLRVVGTDISREAVRCARLNAERHGLADRIEFRHGDLFSPLRPDERFDVIFWNTPVFGEKPEDDLDRAVTSENHECLDRFLREGRSWLREGGRLCIGFILGANPKLLTDLIERHGYDIQPGCAIDLSGKNPLLYVLKPREARNASPTR